MVLTPGGTARTDDADLDEPVVVVPYRPEWADEGAELAPVVAAALRGLACDVQHLGSTAVPGSAAKAVLDVAVAVPSRGWSQAVVRLAALHLRDMGEAGVPGRRYLRRRAEHPVANVHLLEPDGPLWADVLLLRDHLRKHPAEAARYAAVMARAADEHPTLLAYPAAKARTVQELLTRARASSGADGHDQRHVDRAPGTQGCGQRGADHIGEFACCVTLEAWPDCSPSRSGAAAHTRTRAELAARAGQAAPAARRSRSR